VDALELSGEEGRSKLRKAAGRSKHPEIRGLPNGVTRLIRYQSTASEFIGCSSETQGTEPSKYLEEQKTNVIPEVAASETGRA
jgi:hypothetical protein